MKYELLHGFKHHLKKFKVADHHQKVLILISTPREQRKRCHRVKTTKTQLSEDYVIRANPDQTPMLNHRLQSTDSEVRVLRGLFDRLKHLAPRDYYAYPTFAKGPTRAARRARDGHGRRFDGRATGTDRCPTVRRVSSEIPCGTGRTTGRPSTGDGNRRFACALVFRFQ